MKRLKNWQSFNENNARWGFGSFNNDRSANSAAGGAPQQPNDPRLTSDAFDRMRANIAMGQLKMQQITKQVFKDTGWGMKITNNLDLEKLKIIHLFKDENSNTIDLFIEFKFRENDTTYFGKFSNWGAFNNVIFKSNFLTQSEIYNKKVEAVLKRTILKWFEPALGDYKLINTSCRTWDSMGNLFFLKENVRIKVIDVQLENTKPMIHLKIGDKFRYITDADYWYFKWWFVKIEKVEEKVKKITENNLHAQFKHSTTYDDYDVEKIVALICSLFEIYTSNPKRLELIQEIVKKINFETGLSFEIPQSIDQANILLILLEEHDQLFDNDDFKSLNFKLLISILQNISNIFYLKIHGNLDNLMKTGIFN
jgi:hypothetical protein